MNIYRTHKSLELINELIGKEVIVSGWIDAIRNHGKLLFIDLRDDKGIIQLTTSNVEEYKNLTRESVITAKGILKERTSINPEMETGKIEIETNEITIISASNNVLPFEIKTSKEASEDTRLKYRYLDLRNKKMHDNIIFRTKVISYLRSLMTSLDFNEIQTPILTASSPEGAREFIIPARLHKGKFYVLPQAPQIFKQLLMVSGFDKYFQIAPCFRDEDPRSDRLYGEFYQLDFEMSFATEEDVYNIGEKIFYNTFTTFSNKKVSPIPFRRIAYKESMEKYGSDKPDLRNPLIIQDITEIFNNTEFLPFKSSYVKIIKVNYNSKPNSWFNDIVEYSTTSLGLNSLSYIKLKEDGTLSGSIVKYLSDKELNEITKKLELNIGEAIFFITDTNNIKSLKNSGLIRTELGKRLDLINPSTYEFCIINDFPMYEINEETNTYDFTHNPFSYPKGGIESLNTLQPDKVLAYQYDFVCNGLEMSSGAVRNHDIKTLVKAFSIAGYDEEVLKKKFGSLYNAFQYGAPPHAGMAPGIDRMIMLLLEENNIREVTCFPMNANGQDLMMG
ncbi:MAG: aspartate--tRNA ligase, partial [Bacilli bacterium]